MDGFGDGVMKLVSGVLQIHSTLAIERAGGLPHASQKGEDVERERRRRGVLQKERDGKCLVKGNSVTKKTTGQKQREE
jgi:hypothetical protein